MFLIDKYKVNNLFDIFFHKEIYKNLIIGYDPEVKYINNNIDNNVIKILNSRNEKYDNYKSLPNIYIHGPRGVGKHTLINMLLSDIFDENIIKTTKEIYQIKGYSNTSIDVEIEQSRYHILIEPNNSGFDKYLIQEIVKEYAKKNIVNIYHHKFPYRIILINNVDNLNYYAQTSLRCTMEKYYNTCRFILCGHQSSRLIEPIRSRCLNIRLSIPSYEELKNYLYHIMILERKLLCKTEIDRIIETSDGNIKKLIWYYDMSRYKIKDYEFYWKKSIDVIIEKIINIKSIKIFTIDYISVIRTILYNIFITNISGIDILNEIIKKIINQSNFNEILIYKIINLASLYEARLNKGKRTIIHLESFITKVYQEVWLYYNKKDNKQKHEMMSIYCL